MLGKRRFTVRLFVLGSLAALSAPVPAQQSASGWYLGGGLGSSEGRFSSDFQSGIVGVSETKDESDIGGKVFGGYRFTRNWGLEAGYSDLGKFDYQYNAGAAGTASVDYQVSAWTFAGTGTLPVGNAFSLQARLGVAQTKAKTSLVSSSGALATALGAAGVGGSSSKSRTNLLAGVGAQYDFGPRFGVRLDYDNYGKVGDSDNTGRARVDMWSLNAVLRF